MLEYPGPASWDAETYTAPDGTIFPRTSWLPADGRQPRAVVVAVHGLGGATSDWWPLGELCQTRDIAVLAYEVRGMGNDPQVPRRGDLDRRNGWLEDFTSFAKRVSDTYPNVPMIWVGESLGSVIVLNMVVHQANAGVVPDACMLTSPIVRVDGKVGGWREPLVRVLMMLTPRLRVDLQALGDADVASARVVSSTTHADQQEKTPHAISRFTLRLLSRIASLVRENRQSIGALTTPILVLYGGHDVFTKEDEVDAFFEEIGSEDKAKTFFPDGYHLLLHDRDRKRVLRRIEKWLEKIVDNCKE